MAKLRSPLYQSGYTKYTLEKLHWHPLWNNPLIPIKSIQFTQKTSLAFKYKHYLKQVDVWHYATIFSKNKASVLRLVKVNIINLQKEGQLHSIIKPSIQTHTKNKDLKSIKNSWCECTYMHYDVYTDWKLKVLFYYEQ